MATMKLDLFDLKIIDVLQAKGKISCAQIGEIIGLSETACYNRLRKIENSDIIKNYSAAFHAKKITKFQTFFTIISLKSDMPHDLRQFEQEIMKMRSIISCSYVTGTTDYIMKSVAVDLDSYIAMIDEVRERSGNVSRYETLTEVREVKSDPIPLADLGRENLG
jgi:Lrp/AsnC family transcriptional regulator of ectoine degradation